MTQDDLLGSQSAACLDARTGSERQGLILSTLSNIAMVEVRNLEGRNPQGL